MKTKPAETLNAVKLRAQAEKKLSARKKKSEPQAYTKADTLRLVHELEVHQVELEMQNEELTRARAELEKALVQYTDLYDFAPVGYILLGGDGRIRQINLGGASLLGMDRSNLIGKRLGGFVSDESHSVFNGFIENQASDGDTKYCELLLENKERGPVWVNLKATGGISRITIADITARKLAENKAVEIERKLREVNNDLSLAQSLALIGSWKWDLRTSTIEWSDGMYRIFGIDKNSYTGRLGDVIAKVIYPDDLHIVLPSNAEEFARKKPQEYRIIRPNDGDLRHIWALAGETILDEKGSPIYLTGIAQDITERKQAEETLRASTRRFNAIFYNAPLQGIVYRFIRNLQGEIVDWEVSEVNLLGAASVGYEAGQLIGKRATELFGPKVMAPYIETSRQVAASGQSQQFETRFEENGKSYLSSVFLLGDDYYANVSVDISERRQAEDALRLFKTVFDRSSEACAISDSAGRLIYINDAHVKLFGRTLEEAQNVNYREYYPPESIEILDQQVAPALARGESWEGEIEVVGAGGRRFPLWERADSILDSKNTMLYGFGFMHDITERRQVEETLRKDEANLSALLSNTTDRVWAVDTAYRLIVSNPVFRSGIEDWIKSPIRVGESVLQKSLPPEAQDEWRGYYDRALKGEIFNVELPNRLLEQPRTVDYSFHPITQADGTISGVVVSGRDITVRKQAEETIRNYADELEQRVVERTLELLHANRAKDEFLASMSHELRTPLSGILGFCELIGDGLYGPINEKQSHGIDVIRANGEHLLGLINDILDVSKIEAGKFELQSEVLVVNDICRSSLNFIMQQAAQKSIRVEYPVMSGTLSIAADPRRLKQILVNLLNNAVKFTPEKGSVKLEVKADARAGQMRFLVMDTGIGITPEDLQKLFHPFVQVDSRLSRLYEGTGLGLTLVKKLVEMHGGTIEVQSEPGKGSCFSFLLPWEQVIQDHVSQDLPNSETGEHDKKPDVRALAHGRILLAEDHESNLMTIEDFLKSRGYEVFSVHDGREVLSKIEEAAPDLILMDIQMPNMDGIEAASRLRADPRYAAIPIIALTALAMTGDRERCLAAGMNEYLSKPFRMNDLIQIIEKFLKPDAAL